VFEGDPAPDVHYMYQIHLYEFSNGLWEAHAEARRMFATSSVSELAMAVPLHIKLGQCPENLAADRDAFASWLQSATGLLSKNRTATGLLSTSRIMNLRPSQAQPLPPYFADRPLLAAVELLVLESSFWSELWWTVSGARTAERPMPSTWALSAARALVAPEGHESSQARALAYLIAFNADACQDGPSDRLDLLAEDIQTFEATLPEAVKVYLDTTIETARKNCRYAPMVFNRLDFVNCAKAGIDLATLTA